VPSRFYGDLSFLKRRADDMSREESRRLPRRSFPRDNIVPVSRHGEKKDHHSVIIYYPGRAENILVTPALYNRSGL